MVAIMDKGIDYALEKGREKLAIISMKAVFEDYFRFMILHDNMVYHESSMGLDNVIQFLIFFFTSFQHNQDGS